MVRWNLPADKANADLNALDYFGASKETRRCYAWKHFGATSAGTCFFRTEVLSTCLKTEMRPAWIPFWISHQKRCCVSIQEVTAHRWRLLNALAYEKMCDSVVTPFLSALTRLPKMTDHQIPEVIPSAWAKIRLQLQHQKAS